MPTFTPTTAAERIVDAHLQALALGQDTPYARFVQEEAFFHAVLLLALEHPDYARALAASADPLNQRIAAKQVAVILREFPS